MYYVILQKAGRDVKGQSPEIFCQRSVIDAVLIVLSMGIDYEELAGQVKTAKVRSLLIYLGKKGRLEALVKNPRRFVRQQEQQIAIGDKSSPGKNAGVETRSVFGGW